LQKKGVKGVKFGVKALFVVCCLLFGPSPTLPQKVEESFSTTLMIGENTNIGRRKSPTY